MSDDTQVVDLVELLDVVTQDRLRAIPVNYAQPAPHKIGKLNKSGQSLDYQGHAEVTLDLIDIDPEWQIHIATDETGCWAIRYSEDGKEATIFGTMTVLGVTRPWAASVETTMGSTPRRDLYKQLYSDAIKMGAMRFGIATQLWSKAEGRESGAPQPVAVIGTDVANQFVSGLKTLDADLRDSAKQQLVALADTDKIAQIPNDLLAAVTGIVVSVMAEQAKRVPK